MKNILIILILFIGLTCKADMSHDDLVHFSAHFGISYAISMWLYGFNRKVVGLTESESLGFSIFTTLTIGLTYKMIEGITANNFHSVGTSMLYNTMGVGGMYFTIKMFKF